MLAGLPPGAMEQLMSSMGGDGMGGGHRIVLTDEEVAAVSRLCEMGFSRADAVQAYLACDKNEALAANFLMDSMTDSFGDDTGNDAMGGSRNGDGNDDIYG